MAKGGSKVLTAVLSFIIGFLFAILVEVGAVVGVYFFVSTQDLDTVLNTFGLPNRDEDGNCVYVNTDEDGAKTVGELLGKLNTLFLEEGPATITGKTMNDIKGLLPLVNSITDKVYETVDGYIDVDWETFESTSFTEVLPYLQECLMDARPADILEKLDMGNLVGEDSNILIRGLLAGIETEYATTVTGLKFPVYYDVYNYDSALDAYFREHSVNGIDSYPAGFPTEWLDEQPTDNEDGKVNYMLHYVPCKLTAQGMEDADFEYFTYEWEEADELGQPVSKHRTVVKYADDTVYVAVKPDAEGKFSIDLAALAEDVTANMGKNYLYLKDYGASYYGKNYTDCTGHYYYKNSGNEKVRVNSITVGSIVDDAFAPLDYVPITEVVGDDKIIVALFGKSSVGDLMSKEINFDESINNLELSSVMNINPDQAIMAYLGYGLTSVKAAEEGSTYQYSAKVQVEENGVKVTKDCYVVTEYRDGDASAEHNIKEVYYLDDDNHKVAVKGTTVGKVSSRIDALMNEMSLSDVISLDIKANDGIMAYIGYGLSDVAQAPEGSEYDYTATCEVKQTDGETEVTVKKQCFVKTDAEGVITSVWYEEDGARVEVPATTINGISSRLENIMDNLALPDLITIKAEDAILAYVGYGLTGVREDATADHDYVGTVKIDGVPVTCYVKVDKSAENAGKILSVWYNDGVKDVPVYGTKVSGLSDRVNNLTKELALADVIEIPADDAIMAYVGYGITGLVKSEITDYDYVGTYKTAEGTSEVCYVKADPTTQEIIYAWYENAGEKVYIPGTVIDEVSGRISGLTDNVALSDVIDVKADSSIMSYMGYGLTGVTAAPAGSGYDYTATYEEKLPDSNGDGKEEVVKHNCYITVDADGKILSVWYMDGSVKVPVNGTTISMVPDRIDGLTAALTLADVIDVPADESIMAYMGYGVVGVKPAPADSGYDYTATYKERFSDSDGDGKDEIVEHECYITKDAAGNIVSVWYMDNGVRKNVPATTIDGITDRIKTMRYDLVLGDIIEIKDDSSKILKALSDTPIGGIGDKITSLTVNDMFEPEDIEGNAILSQLRNTKITELATAIDKLVIQRIYSKEVYGLPEDCDPMEVVAFDESKTYYELVEITADGGKTKHNVFQLVNQGAANEGELTVDEFINRGVKTYFVKETVTEEGGATKDVYKVVGYYIKDDGTTQTVQGFADGWLFYELVNGEYDLTKKYTTGADGKELQGTAYDDRLGRLVADDMKTGKKYYSYGETRGMWRLVLTKDMEIIGSDTKEEAPREKAYTLNNFNNMVNVCAQNVYGATLGELQDAGIIGSDTNLDINLQLKVGTLTNYIKPDGSTTTNQSEAAKMREFTLKQLLNVVLKFLTPQTTPTT